ncbi:MAG: tRNA (adenosine(37)-N6)-threonylcarbamoyltransferase complex dimerization subunit type 1 TsaB [Cyanobacteria bacterium SZAS LIN-2]|nr:tRNA (adenosine(37)-N6)-threonylcarbamoyltransferase complex dimerization subunit type 1 TsaB [Cyanobacteria bacterium SZAS LIN-2]
MPLRILSFDTSGRGLSVAIAEDGRVLVEANSESDGRDRADRQESVSLLMPTIDELVRGAGLKKSDLHAIAVGVGPGGFTGVRVAVVTARTLAQALRLPLVGVNSLEVASYFDPSARLAHPAGVIKEASKTHCFVARYERVAFAGPGAEAQTVSQVHDLRPLMPPTYMTDESLAKLLDDAENAASDRREETLWYAEAAVLGRFERFGARLMPAITVNNVAACQAKIAHVRLSLKAGEGPDRLEELLRAFPYQQIQPLYLRGASVTLKKGDVIERVETH